MESIRNFMCHSANAFFIVLILIKKKLRKKLDNRLIKKSLACESSMRGEQL